MATTPQSFTIYLRCRIKLKRNTEGYIYLLVTLVDLR